MKYKNWVFLLIINLLIVATLGLLMRYKITFSLPMIDQKHLQHAHSHFAFVAWISQALYLIMIHFLEGNVKINTKLYSRILLVNTILSYAMMLAFILKGYHFTSNTFSFLLLLNSLVFSYFFIRDTWRLEVSRGVLKWFYAALFFNFFSSFGTFHLAYMMINKIYVQEKQLASVYFYLHFQYNGWFLFSCLALMFHQLSKIISIKNLSILFWIFFISTIPNYFLSILWFKIPVALYVFVIISAFSQLLVWFYLLYQFRSIKEYIREHTDVYYKWIFWILTISFTIKLCLQMASTVPYLSHLAYSLRPIVIAYLHLVLLVIISVFILQYLYKYILERKVNLAIFLFVIFVLVNELLLGLQGFAGMFTINIPYIHYYLLGISFLLFSSIINILYRMYKV